ncbi:hypothetical protein SK128_005018 [Halocaridina rubra]|uniref:Uncharacterized protein n=1 Tax=Halocaridina rubra TaxID=373956 RepID=A0AAN8ZZM8_HALRR
MGTPSDITVDKHYNLLGYKKKILFLCRNITVRTRCIYHVQNKVKKVVSINQYVSICCLERTSPVAYPGGHFHQHIPQMDEAASLFPIKPPSPDSETGITKNAFPLAAHINERRPLTLPRPPTTPHTHNLTPHSLTLLTHHALTKGRKRAKGEITRAETFIQILL